MKELVEKVCFLLIKQKKKLAIAESCTGGLLSHYFTYFGGSSQYFILGIVAYSNESKIKILSIPKELIIKKGAVSPEVALSMAKNVKKITKADIGIAITGIAGPTGGTPLKPIGTVYISIVGKKTKIVKRFIFKGNRNKIKKETVKTVFKLLKRELER